MIVTLNEILTLVGRLDDSPGFDSSRERFRRFLLDRVTTEIEAQALVNDCQRSIGEQHHRALQDLVVFLGRFLGFETTFGVYEPLAGGVKVAGQWRSSSRLEVVLEIRTDHTNDATVDALKRSMAAVAATAHGEVEKRVGLCVVARQYAARARLERAIATDSRDADIRVVGVHSLLFLAARIAAGRLTHDDIVRLVQSGSDLDLVVDLLDRGSGRAPIADEPESEDEPEPAFEQTRGDPSFWVAALAANDAATPEQLLATVIAKRRVLGICQTQSLQNEGAPGDWVCFFLPAKGIVGHAQLASVVDDAASVVRQPERFSRVYRLANVDIYEEPIAQALRAGRPFAVPESDVPLAGPCLSPISRDDFIGLTACDEMVAVTGERRSRSLA